MSKYIGTWEALGSAGALLMGGGVVLLAGVGWALVLWGALLMALAIAGARNAATRAARGGR